MIRRQQAFLITTILLMCSMLLVSRLFGQETTLVLNAEGHTSVVNRVFWMSDDQELLSISDDKTIRLWDVASGAVIRVLRPPIGPGYEGMIYAAALSPNEELLAIGGYPVGNGTQGHPILLISLRTGEIIRELLGHGDAIQDLAFSPDGKYLISGCHDRTARLWDVATGEEMFVLKGHQRPVYGVCFSPQGDQCATAAYDGFGIIWSMETGKPKAVLAGHQAGIHCVDWSPDGNMIATGSLDHTIKLWSSTGKLLKDFNQLGAYQIVSVAFSQDSERLLYANGSGQGTNIAGILPVATNSPPQITFTEHRNSLLHAGFSKSETRVASADAQGVIWTWQTDSGAPIRRFASRGADIYSAAWSADGRRIAWGNTNAAEELNAQNPLEKVFDLTQLHREPIQEEPWQRARYERDGISLRLVSPTAVDVIRRGQAVRRMQFKSSYDRLHNRIRCYTLLPDNLAAIGADFGLYLFNIRSGEQVKEFRGHTGTVWAVSPSPDGRHLLTASSDQTLRIWSPSVDEPVLSLFFANHDWIAWTPDGAYACSPGGEKLMGWHRHQGPHRLGTFVAAAQLRHEYYQPEQIRRLIQAPMDVQGQPVAVHVRPPAIETILPPEVSIIEPTLIKTTISESSLEIHAEAMQTGTHPVLSMQLLVDGSPYAGQLSERRFDPQDGKQLRREFWQIALSPGKHLIQVAARSAVSEGLSKVMEVTYQPSSDEILLPTLYVLAIGVSDYKDETLQLHYAHRDAEAFSELMSLQGERLFRKVNVNLVTNEQATSEGIRRGFSWLRQKMTQYDIGIVYYSGHGARDFDGTFHLLPHDVIKDDLLATGVPESFIHDVFRSVRGRKLMMLDCCHAGLIGAARNIKSASSLADNLVRDLVTNEFGVIMLCSCSGDEQAKESHRYQHGYFSVAVLEGLTGEKFTDSKVFHPDLNQDGAIYWNELDIYVSNRVQEISGGTQQPVTAHPTIRPYPLTLLKLAQD